jgi:hypothetical protein
MYSIDYKILIILILPSKFSYNLNFDGRINFFKANDIRYFQKTLVELNLNNNRASLSK